MVFDDVSNLSPDELTALSFCVIEGSISNHRLQYVLNMHSADITGLLKKLCATGYLESDNNGRWTIYKLRIKVDTLEEKVATDFKSAESEDEIKRKVATSDSKVATSDIEKVATSGENVATSGQDINGFYNKNLKREELELIILKLCKEQYVKKEELARKLGKSENYIRNRILPDLLKSGKLVKRYPYTHNHPEQGYMTSEDYAKEL